MNCKNSLTYTVMHMFTNRKHTRQTDGFYKNELT